jgi:hypothetical protein
MTNFIVIFVDLWLHLLLGELSTSSYLLMISCFWGVYTIKSKDDLFGKFQEFISPVENQSNETIKGLRSNSEGDYICNDFHSFPISQGLSWQRIVPYTPQQNGVAERKNMAI